LPGETEEICEKPQAEQPVPPSQELNQSSPEYKARALPLTNLSGVEVLKRNILHFDHSCTVCFISENLYFRKYLLMSSQRTEYVLFTRLTI
jgi:hypothetical protein